MRTCSLWRHVCTRCPGRSAASPLSPFHGEEQRAFEDFSRRSPPPAGPDRADPLGLRGCGPDARPWPAAGRRRSCGGRTYDRSGPSYVLVLLPDEPETVRRNDRRPGRIFPAGVRAAMLAGGGSLDGICKFLQDAPLIFAFSRFSRNVFRSIPPAYPVRLPSDPTTRWQGTIMERLLWPTAPPTAWADMRESPRFFAS